MPDESQTASGIFRATTAANEPTVITDRHGIYLRGDYYITWDRLDSYPKLCEGVCHLAPKCWVTPRLLAQLIFHTERHHGWPHHYGA